MIPALTFGDPIYEATLNYSSLIQGACLFTCLLSYVCAPSNRAASLLVLMGVYNLYANVTEAAFTEFTSIYYFLESLSFFSWAVILMTRYEHKTSHDIDCNNVLLAFYKGKKGSFIMRFFNLFGLDVKSMCIIVDDKCMILKKRHSSFQLKDSQVLLNNRDDYVIIDTNVRVTNEFKGNMMKVAGKSASTFKLRIMCIKAVAPLLAQLGDKFKPNNVLEYIPSIYLRKIHA